MCVCRKQSGNAGFFLHLLDCHQSQTKASERVKTCVSGRSITLSIICWLLKELKSAKAQKSGKNSKQENQKARNESWDKGSNDLPLGSYKHNPLGKIKPGKLIWFAMRKSISLTAINSCVCAIVSVRWCGRNFAHFVCDGGKKTRHDCFTEDTNKAHKYWIAVGAHGQNHCNLRVVVVIGAIYYTHVASP